MILSCFDIVLFSNQSTTNCFDFPMKHSVIFKWSAIIVSIELLFFFFYTNNIFDLPLTPPTPGQDFFGKFPIPGPKGPELSRGLPGRGGGGGGGGIVTGGIEPYVMN